jgi:threonine aldolase
MPKRGFASDNNAGVHPLIMQSVHNVNLGHTIAYGDDPYTEKAISLIKKSFGTETEVFFVFNGTAANVLGLDSVTQPYNSIICAESAHINVDECGAPEKFTGCKLLSVATKNGKLSIDSIKKHIHGFEFEHHSQPRVISLTQSTEMGTVYSSHEIKTICDFAHRHNMVVHMDGARISNAAASLGLSFREFTTDSGLDVLSFGGTKNGMMYGEAVIFFNKQMAKDFKYRRKQGMQLASKMRFISAQFIAFLENDLWHTNALHANEMAKLLYQSVMDLKGVKVTQEVQSNGVFAIIPPSIIPDLQKEYFFYMWDETKSEVRWMTSFDTTEEDIAGFVSKLKELLERK